MNKLLNSLITKIFSWTLLLSFIFVYVFRDYTFASKYFALEAEMAAMGQYIEIPFEYGQISERFQPKTAKSKVIIIQDYHANYKVQKNISAMLKHINEEYGIEKIGVEGSSSEVDVSLLASAPEKEIKHAVCEFFMEKGTLTGPEEFISTQKTPVLYGLEDQELYEKDKEILLSSLDHRDDIVKNLEQLKYMLKSVENKICSANLKKFKSQYILYKQNKLSPYTFQKYLRQWAQTANIPISTISTEYNKYLAITEKEQGLDYKNIEKEYKKLLKDLNIDRERSGISLVFESFKNILGAPESIRDQMVSKIFNDPNYSCLRNYLECIQMSGEINTYQVLGDEGKVVKKVSAGLCANEGEKHFLIVSNYVELMIKFLLNQMTRDELDEFYAGSEVFENSFNALNIDELSEFSNIDALLSNLAPYAQLMKNFYDTACERDGKFVEKFVTPSVSEGKNLVMVTGGFHACGISDKLKEKGIPYLRIVPRVSSYTEEDLRRYYALLRETEKLSYEEMLLALPSFFGKQWFLRRIVFKIIREYIDREIEENGFNQEQLKEKVNKLIAELEKKQAQATGKEAEFGYSIKEFAGDKDELILFLDLDGESKILAVDNKRKFSLLTEEDAKAIAKKRVKPKVLGKSIPSRIYDFISSHKIITGVGIIGAAIIASVVFPIMTIPAAIVGTLSIGGLIFLSVIERRAARKPVLEIAKKEEPVEERDLILEATEEKEEPVEFQSVYTEIPKSIKHRFKVRDKEAGSIGLKKGADQKKLRKKYIKTGTNLKIIRHGESEANVSHIITGITDTPLSLNGEKQAREAAEKMYIDWGGDERMKRVIKKEDRFPVIHSSPLKRGKMTGMAFVNMLNSRAKEISIELQLPTPEAVEIIELDLLKEISFGDMEGATIEEARKGYDRFNELNIFAGGSGKDLLYAVKNGESQIQIIEKMNRFLEDLLKKYEGRDNYVFSHLYTGLGMSIAMGYIEVDSKDDAVKLRPLDNAEPIALVDTRPSAKDKIVLATSNNKKLKEMVQIFNEFDIDMEIESTKNYMMTEVDETGSTLNENASLKANNVLDHLGCSMAIGDDTGVFVEHLDGSPGVFTKRYAGENATSEESVKKLLTNLEGVPKSKRKAQFRCVICLSRPGEKDLFAEGIVNGYITEEPRGTGGFGRYAYDAVFEVGNTGKTFAEMSQAQKNKSSHRYLALAKMGEIISGLKKGEIEDKELEISL
ncbi:RdgB/HAM1 family non-canonical purine NTP pyrophosphatase, partial [Elusimicrobiota bacterium]